MTKTPLPEEWLLTTTSIPYWAIALVLLIAVVIFAIFNVQAGQPSSNPSNIQKRFGLITWSRRAAHIIIGLWGCALAMLMGAFLLTTFQLIQEILATSNQDIIRQLAIALPAVAAASAGLIALPITLNRLQLTNRQTLAKEEGLITDRINAAVLGLGAEKTVKVTEEGQVIERTEPNIEVRIGAILALERIAKNNLDVHIQIMDLLSEYVNSNCGITKEEKPYPEAQSPRADIQRAIYVVGKKSLEQLKLEENEKYRVSFENCDLSNVDFHQLHFSGAAFTNCIFNYAVATDVNFRGARFVDCNFDRIDLRGSDFTGVTLQQVTFKTRRAGLSLTLPQMTKGLIALNCNLTAVEFLWPETITEIFSSGDTKWGIDDVPKPTREREIALHEIDLEIEVEPEIQTQLNSGYRYFYPFSSYDMATYRLIDEFNKKMGHIRFPFTSL